MLVHVIFLCARHILLIFFHNWKMEQSSERQNRLTRTEDNKPWHDLDFEIAEEAEEMFLSCKKCELGNGRRLNFWKDRWPEGRSIEQLAPNLMQFVRTEAKKLKVASALHDNLWVAEIWGSLSIPTIAEFLDISELISTLNLQEVEVNITWKLSASGVYYAKSAYRAFFSGSSN
jgi:hypothetical protein